MINCTPKNPRHSFPLQCIYCFLSAEARVLTKFKLPELSTTRRGVLKIFDGDDILFSSSSCNAECPYSEFSVEKSRLIETF